MNHQPGQIVGYRRVSSIDQNLDRQLDGIVLDRVFEDKLSGKNLDRPDLKRCLDHLRQGDTLVVHSIDRLSRSTMDFCTIAKDLHDRGITLQIISPPLTINSDGKDPYAMCQLQIMASFAELERSLIRIRQAEGIASARKRGVYGGSKPKLSTEQIAELKARIAIGVNKSKVAKEFGITRQTLYSYLSI